MRSQRPALLLHGGAGKRTTPQRLAAIRRSLRACCAEGMAHLQNHGALATAVLIAQRLEDDPLFNAGTGSVPQADGRVRMSASVMDGASRRFAAVLNIEGVRHPVAIARALLGQPDRILAGEHARRFARTLGCRPWNPLTPERLRQWQRRSASSLGTIGVVVVDREGRLAAATSTGGKRGQRAGRVSDSGLPVGNYATDRAAVSCTGLGEDIIDEALAPRLLEQVACGTSLARAFTSVWRSLAPRHRQWAAIGVDREGRLAWASTLPILYAVGHNGQGNLETF